jgi:hypothetical protein
MALSRKVRRQQASRAASLRKYFGAVNAQSPFGTLAMPFQFALCSLVKFSAMKGLSALTRPMRGRPFDDAWRKNDLKPLARIHVHFTG